MFNIKEFVLTNLINGVNKGIFAKEYASTLATNYFLKGILSSEDIERFDEETIIKESIAKEISEETILDNIEEAEENTNDNTL